MFHATSFTCLLHLHCWTLDKVSSCSVATLLFLVRLENVDTPLQLFSFSYAVFLIQYCCVAVLLCGGGEQQRYRHGRPPGPYCVLTP